MGTAVDANIIIYERAKEELRAGKSLMRLLKSPIVDRSDAFYRRCKRYAYLDWCCCLSLVQDLTRATKVLTVLIYLSKNDPTFLPLL
jgi:hypothetical protein